MLNVQVRYISSISSSIHHLPQLLTGFDESIDSGGQGIGGRSHLGALRSLVAPKNDGRSDYVRPKCFGIIWRPSPAEARGATLPNRS